jgi:hypothetical protein
MPVRGSVQINRSTAYSVNLLTKSWQDCGVHIELLRGTATAFIPEGLCMEVVIGDRNFIVFSLKTSV